MQPIDVVFEGGGSKGIALSGGLRALEERGLRPRRLVGTSAGAITAAASAVSYSAEELLAITLEKTADGQPVFTTFADAPAALSDSELLHSAAGHVLEELDIPLLPERAEEKIDVALLRGFSHLPGMRSLFSLTQRGGLHAGDAFHAWFSDKLEARGEGFGAATFAQLHEATGRDLSLVASDTTAHGELVLNHRTAPDLPVSWATRMSMSIPFFWVPVRWRAEWGLYMGRDLSGHPIVDGGVVSNFALKLFAEPEDSEVQAWMGPPPEPAGRPLGFYLDPHLPVPGSDTSPPTERPHEGLVQLIEALLDTMMDAHDNAEVRAHPRAVCRLPVQGYKTLDFGMSEARVKALYDAGLSAAGAYLEGLGG